MQSAVSVYTEAWPVVCDAQNSVCLSYFRLMFVSQKVVTPGRANSNFMVYATVLLYTMDKSNGDRLLNKQSCSSHSFDGFHTHI